jgi:hypothetical protein
VLVIEAGTVIADGEPAEAIATYLRLVRP